MYVKILSLFVILIITILCGFLPKYISTHSSKKSLNQFLGIANAFSGGIFIGIAFFHLLPESAEGFEQYFATFETKSKFEKFPFYFLFAFLSYTLVLFVEKIAFDSHSLIDHNHGENSSNKENDSYFDKSIKTNENSNRIENVHDHGHNHEIKNDHDHSHNHEDENHNHNHDHDNNHNHHNNNDSPSKIKAKNITTNKRFQTIGEKTDINITFKNSSEEKLKEIEDYKNLIGTDNNMVSNNLNEPLIIKNKDKSLTFKQSFNCINQAFKNDMYNEYGPEVYKKVFEDDENADSEDEEEIIKYVIGNKADISQRKSLSTVNQIKSNNSNIPDIELFKAGQILSKTYRNKIYNEDCLATIKECEIEEGDRISIHNHDHEFQPSSNLTPYVLLIALSIHGLFEGIALGLQQNDQNSIFLAIAIISHKWAESFTLGISFYKSNIDETLYTRLILIFSVFSPVGILIGLVVNNSSILMEAIFLSLSGGTFLYIAASEIIIEEFSVSKNKYVKFIVYIIGCLFVALLAVVEVFNEIDG